MKTFAVRFWLQRLICWSLICGLISLLVSCTPSNLLVSSPLLNSRYGSAQPAFSGNGKFLAFVSHGKDRQSLLVYDWTKHEFIPTPGLNQPSTIAESPSLSYSGRYICYLTSQQDQLVIALYDRATETSQIITPGYRSWIRHPYINPDGRYIVFESASRGEWDIEVLDRGPTVELDIPNGSIVNVPN